MRTEQVLERLKPCHFIWSNSNHILQAQYQASCWLSWLWTVKTMVLSVNNNRSNKKPCLEPISNKFSLLERSLNVQININLHELSSFCIFEMEWQWEHSCLSQKEMFVCSFIKVLPWKSTVQINIIDFWIVLPVSPNSCHYFFGKRTPFPLLNCNLHYWTIQN